MQLTSPSRRVFGFLAAGTIGLSTALLGVTGVASAAPDPALVPNAPLVIDTPQGGDGTGTFWFDPNHAEDGTTPQANKWEYSLTSSGGSGNTTGFEPATLAQDGWEFSSIDLDGLTNGTTYTISVRGIAPVNDPDLGEDVYVDVAGPASTPATFTPYKSIGAPASPTVAVGPSSLKISWAAPTVAGTYALAGYEVLADLPAAPGAQSWSPTTICKTDAATTSCTAPIKAGRAYTIEVHALDAEGHGSEATPVTSDVVPDPAVPAAVPTKNGDLTLPAGAKSTVAPGKTMTVSGSGYAPNSTVTLAIYSTPQVLTTVVTDASGNFTATVTVPAGLAAGNHTLVASGVDSSGNVRYVNLAVTVSGSGAATLAYTGADVVLPAIGGLVAVAVGGGLIVASRRRSASSAA